MSPSPTKSDFRMQPGEGRLARFSDAVAAFRSLAFGIVASGTIATARGCAAGSRRNQGRLDDK